MTQQSRRRLLELTATGTAISLLPIAAASDDQRSSREQIPYDLAVSNSGQEHHVVHVQIYKGSEDDAKEHKVFDRKYRLEGMNTSSDPSQDQYRTNHRLEIDAGERYRVIVSLKDGTKENLDWAVWPGTGVPTAQALSIRVTPQGEIDATSMTT